MTSVKQRYPGESDVAHPTPFIVAPSEPREKKPGQLPWSEILKFFEEGYIVVRDFFTREELDPCIQDIELMVDQLAYKLCTAGKIKNLYKDYGVFQRLTKIEEEHQGANILLFKYQKMPKSIQNLWSNERILNLMEQILGPDVAGHPVWNLRTKTPKSEAVNIPWHQDSAYFSNESYDHMIATAWIPFLDATEENGCMEMAKFGHRPGKVAVHQCCSGPTWYIMLAMETIRDTLGVDLSKDIVTEPVKYGGFILFNNLTPHRSLPNNSNDVRWSVDLRWQSPKHPYGFYNIQDGIVFRSADKPDVKPDWQRFFSVDRKLVWQQKFSKKEKLENDEFDTRITGPWIGQWEVVNQNDHTDLFQQIIS